jgi:predicted transcriptional regulator|tara:strand:+ start:206 stop:460 length:255 start_codon:yes stop_codon:yes gene_type:complete
MSTPDITNDEPVLVLDDEKYIISDLSDTAKYVVANIQDIDNQLRTIQMKVDQLNMAKEGMTARLKEEVAKPKETEVVETPTEDG